MSQTALMCSTDPHDPDTRDGGGGGRRGGAGQGIHLFYHTDHERTVSWVTTGAIVMRAEHKMGKGP